MTTRIKLQHKKHNESIYKFRFKSITCFIMLLHYFAVSSPSWWAPSVEASSITLFLFPSWAGKLHESCSPAQQRSACRQRPAPFHTSGTAWTDFGSKRSKTSGSWTCAAWPQAWQSKRRTLTSGRTRCGCRCIAWRCYQQDTPKA